jgi:hypothetical protein
MWKNYDTKLSGEIITGNYELVYYVSENVGIIEILAYPKNNLTYHHRRKKKAYPDVTTKKSMKFQGLRM